MLAQVMGQLQQADRLCLRLCQQTRRLEVPCSSTEALRMQVTLCSAQARSQQAQACLNPGIRAVSWLNPGPLSALDMPFPALICLQYSVCSKDAQALSQCAARHCLSLAPL